MIAPYITVYLDSKGPAYTYKNHVEGLAKDDQVVVCLPSGKFTCGRVESLTPSDTEIERATKYIVCKVDTDAWRALSALDPPPKYEPDDDDWYRKVAEMIKRQKAIVPAK